MKFRKLLLSILAIITLSLSTACSSTDAVDNKANQRTNFLGIYTSEPASYEAVNPATFRVRTDDYATMELPSGQKTTWLWGLITYTDY